MARKTAENELVVLRKKCNHLVHLAQQQKIAIGGNMEFQRAGSMKI